MFDPVTFTIAAVLLLGISIYGRLRRRRARARAREFDGGWSIQNERRITRVYSDNIINMRHRHD